MTVAPFPGATRLTLLEVYVWETPDGLRGAHVHLASTEGYYVLSGAGRLQTLSGDGYSEQPLRPGDCLWFTPGTIHRLVNDSGDLRILVVMQNAGLPEHGDAVLTFPPEILADADAYAAAAHADSAPTARRRRDLSLEGYLRLRAGGEAALSEFHAAAARLTGGRVEDWRERWRDGALAAAETTGRQLDALASGAADYLASGGVRRISRPDGPKAYGMCGRLTTY
jgi:mannose-6-phosphate isomerase-like protein (cupin superfamily)